ncbi:MAG TPA: hypothetical protein VFN48_05850 [Solirubrobacteraceae bacterium]|nr:hypothetical protein [Solirubrobacteraceae bacterium]
MLRPTRIRSIYRVTPDRDAPAVARRIAAHELADVPSTEIVENAELLLSEITAERLTASQASDPRRTEIAPEQRITIDVGKSRERQRWAVVDRGSPSMPAGLRSAALDKIAQAWGVSRRMGLTRTWFELEDRSRRRRDGNGSAP